MRKVICDYCGLTSEFERQYFTSYPSPFTKVEMNHLNYEFCSNDCKKNGLLKILNEMEVTK